MDPLYLLAMASQRRLYDDVTARHPVRQRPRWRRTNRRRPDLG
jgi:hypothetical protein